MQTLKSWLLSVTLLLALLGVGQSALAERNLQVEHESSSTASTADSSDAGDQISREEDAIEFLEGICGSDAEIEIRDEFLSPRRATCMECPEEARDGELHARWGIKGDFLGDGSETVFFLVAGCMGRRLFLLEDEETGWTIVTESLGAQDCTRVPGESQDVLICRLLTGLESGKELSPTLGRQFRVIYVEDRKIRSNMIKEVSHHSRDCECGGDVGRELEEVVLEDLSGDGRDELALGFRTVLPAGRAVDELDVECAEDLGEYVEKTQLYIWEFGPDGLDRRRDIESTVEHPTLEKFRSKNLLL